MYDVSQIEPFNELIPNSTTIPRYGTIVQISIAAGPHSSVVAGARIGIIILSRLGEYAIFTIRRRIDAANHASHVTRSRKMKVPGFTSGVEIVFNVAERTGNDIALGVQTIGGI